MAREVGHEWLWTSLALTAGSLATGRYLLAFEAGMKAVPVDLEDQAAAVRVYVVGLLVLWWLSLAAKLEACCLTPDWVAERDEA